VSDTLNNTSFAWFIPIFRSTDHCFSSNTESCGEMNAQQGAMDRGKAPLYVKSSDHKISSTRFWGKPAGEACQTDALW
jgi:hypothetical protein